MKRIGRPLKLQKPLSVSERQSLYRQRAKQNAEIASAPKYVIFSSYGNDSCALIQYAHEQQLENVAVVYSETNWSADGWQNRILKKEKWCKSLNFKTYRTESIGFENLARKKSGFPSNRFQWCSYALKIEPALKWLDQHDPQKRAICLIGVRREESQLRSNYPEFSLNSVSHGGRPLIAPLVKLTALERDQYLIRANIDVLPHRSRECLCINSNRKDLRKFTENDIQRIEKIESEIGKSMFRPQRYSGAKGIREIIDWANSDHGKYSSESFEELENFSGCSLEFCET